MCPLIQRQWHHPLHQVSISTHWKHHYNAPHRHTVRATSPKPRRAQKTVLLQQTHHSKHQFGQKAKTVSPWHLTGLQPWKKKSCLSTRIKRRNWFSFHKKKTLISTRWIFKSKLKPDGSLNKCNAHLIARGFEQKHAVDFDKIFALVVKWGTIRTVVALAT